MIEDIKLTKDQWHLGNPNLRRANVRIQYTEEQVEEYIRCANDYHYFIQYVKIVNVDKGLITFEPYPFQWRMLDTFHDNRFSICKLPRQSGKSTTVISYMLWLILFNDNFSIAMLAHKGDMARELLGRLRLAYEYLPNWLKQGIETWNKGDIQLENGSRIIAAATSSSAIRGGSYNLIFLDEFAFVQSNQADEFFASVYPTISSGNTTKVIIVSTPKGMNHFYKRWVDAEEGRSDYKTIEIAWNDVPGRDEKWREMTIRNTSEEQFAQEFACEFLGSSNTLISPTKLKNLAFITPMHDTEHLKIYKEPIKDRTYAMTVDVAHGVGLDYSTFTIFDISEMPYRVVAIYRNNQISSLLFPNIVVQVATKYNNAMVLVELNDQGKQVADIIHQDLEYEYLLMTSTKGPKGQVISGGFAKNLQFGVKTSPLVRSIGCSNLKEMIESDKLVIQDFNIIQELSTFIFWKNKYQAEEGAHDDLVMNLVLFGWLVRQDYFRDITDINVRQKLIDEKQKMLDDDTLPLGMMDDGRDLDMIDADGTLWEPIETW